MKNSFVLTIHNVHSYCMKLQIGLAANIFGSAEEEHAGGTYQ